MGYSVGCQEKMPQQPRIFSLGLAEAGKVFSRNDQYVGRRLGIQVAEGKRAVIFPENFGRQAFVGNLAENAIFHAGIVAETQRRFRFDVV